MERIDNVRETEKSQDREYMKVREAETTRIKSLLTNLREKIHGDQDHLSYQVFKESEKLGDIGKMTREIDGSGFAIRTNRKKFRLTNLYL